VSPGRDSEDLVGLGQMDSKRKKDMLLTCSLSLLPGYLEPFLKAEPNGQWEVLKDILTHS